MAYLIALDDGHGMETLGKRTPPIPQLGGRVIKENEFNRAVVKFLDAELKRCGFKTLLVAPTDEDTPLSVRTDKANAAGADLYVSCHYNAGGGEGIETYHYPGSTKGKQVAEIIHKHLLESGVPRKNRGVKTANFHVLRESKMPAVLIEYGFMDDPGLDEAAQMIDPTVQKKFAIATAKGICEYFGVKYVPEQQQTPQQPQTPKQPQQPQSPPAYLKAQFTRELRLTRPMMYGDDVKKVQHRLNIKVDGWYGPLTESAVENWQRTHDIEGIGNPHHPANGVVDKKTWDALFVDEK